MEGTHPTEPALPSSWQARNSKLKFAYASDLLVTQGKYCPHLQLSCFINFTESSRGSRLRFELPYVVSMPFLLSAHCPSGAPWLTPTPGQGGGRVAVVSECRWLQRSPSLGSSLVLCLTLTEIWGLGFLVGFHRNSDYVLTGPVTWVLPTCSHCKVNTVFLFLKKRMN